MTTSQPAALLPRASLRDVLTGAAPLVGSRLDPARPRGLVSPIEARIHMGLPYGDLLQEEADRLSGSPALGALAAASLAAALAPRGPAPRRPFLVAASVDNLSIAEATDAIFAPSTTGRARIVHFVHPHALNLAADSPELRAQLSRADVVLPDGVGLRLAARLLGISLRDNVNGTDLLPLLCRRACDEGRPLVLIGAAPGVAEECAARLRRDFPGLQIPLCSHGFLDEEASTALAARVAALPRPLVLVAMGSPLQEAWMWRHLSAHPSITALSVGGLFDFFAGRVQRAPWLWRELGLEWLYRLRCEPRRLARRYLLGNPLFLLRALRQRALGRDEPAPPRAPLERFSPFSGRSVRLPAVVWFAFRRSFGSPSGGRSVCLSAVVRFAFRRSFGSPSGGRPVRLPAVVGFAFRR